MTFFVSIESKNDAVELSRTFDASTEKFDNIRRGSAEPFSIVRSPNLPKTFQSNMLCLEVASHSLELMV